MLARQRLIGAVVLVIIGVVGFPLVFETQPRPIPVDVPIEIPRKENAPALSMPPRTSPVATAASAARDPASAANDVITETREDAGREVAVAPVAVAPEAKPAARPEASKPEAKPETRPAKPPVVATAEPRPDPKNSTDAARARDLLDGKNSAATPSAANGRYVLQVGAFADASQAHETRVKVEKLGMKTYTQVASTPAGNRIRVRVGPFANRDEADKALAKARGAGLSGVVLTL